MAGCTKTIEIHDPGIGSMIDLDVDSNFKWQTSKEVDLNISSNLAALPPGSLSRIEVYQGDPQLDGKLLMSGAAGYDFPFSARLRISRAITSIFLRLTTLYGYDQTVEVPVQNEINYTFVETSGTKQTPVVAPWPDCLSGCDGWLTGSGSFVISDGQTYCITDSYSGHITIQHGTLKVCGTFTGTISMGQEENICKLLVTGTGSATISSLSMSRNCSMVIYGNGQVTIGSISMIHNATLENFGILRINNNFTHPGLLRNMGNLLINGQYTIGATSSELENYGSLTVNSDWVVNGNVKNNGTTEVFGNIFFNGKTVQNNCLIKSNNEVVFNTMIYKANHGYLQGVLGVTITEGARLTLQNQSMISTSVFLMKNNLTGVGSTSVIKCTSSGAIIGAQKYVIGAMEMLTPDGTLLSGSYPENFRDSASLKPLADASAYIPTGECNPEGSGYISPDDSDGDGVADQLDDFPSDGSRAFVSWYPEASGFGTLIFEDLWPYQGDYDMNDAVIDYQYRIITNARNQVVDIHPKFYLRAAGATLKNGFGFQIDQVQPVTIASVSGYVYKFNYIKLNENGTESSQANAVIIVWDNADNIIHRVGQRTEFNTLPNYPAGHSDSVFIHIHFAIPQDQQVVGPPPYNPFLIKNLDRNLEIHMPDYIPTSLANPAYFGTADDDSDPALGRYYKTSKNLLWATNITEKYHYTYETIEILWGYYHFAEWCESSGNSYPDWYRDLPGYRHENYIYDITF